MITIERSPGIPITVGQVCYGFAGGGHSGTTTELDAVVQRAAELLREAYGMDVMIRFNSDRESGGAYLKTHEVDAVGRNSEIGIAASVVTERARRSWQQQIGKWGGDDPEWTDMLRERLATEPAGTLHIYAHLSEQTVKPGVLEEGERYYHRGHSSLEDALAFVLANGSLDHLEAS